jgi:hypothetical protein
MRQRYFLIEPKYADPDAFCCFTRTQGVARQT